MAAKVAVHNGKNIKEGDKKMIVGGKMLIADDLILVAVVTAIAVFRYFHVRLHELAGVWQVEAEIAYVQAAFHPHAFVISLNSEQRRADKFGRRGVVKVVGDEIDGQMVEFHHEPRVSEEKVGIGLEMHDAAVDKEAAVALHEVGGSEALARILHLRVGKGEPYFLHLVGTEETVYYLDACTQEGYVSELFLQGLFCSRPHSCALDVDADEVDVGIQPCQAHGVFAAAAAQLEHDGVVIVEILFAPVAAHVERHVADYGEWILEHVLESLNFGEFRQLALAHCCLSCYKKRKRAQSKQQSGIINYAPTNGCGSAYNVGA